MRTTYKDDPEERRGAGALIIAWLLLFAFVAAVIGWLYITGNQTGVSAGIPGVTAPIPPDIALAQRAPEPDPGPAQTSLPETERRFEEPLADEPAFIEGGSADAPDAADMAATPQTIEEVIAAADAEEAAAPETDMMAPGPETDALAGPEEGDTESMAAVPATPAETEALDAGAEAEGAAAETGIEPEPAPPEPAVEDTAEVAAAEAEPAEMESTAQPPETEPEPQAEAKAETEPAEAPAPAPETQTAKAEAVTPPAKPEPRPAPPAPETQAPEQPAVETNLAALPEPTLRPAPDPALVERGREGPLPIIGADGRKPWEVYARPFDESDTRPRIAVVITGLGLSGAATETAIQQLPGSVTLAFSPYAKNLDKWMNLARTAGHEVLLDLPMEPMDYPKQDPGPYTLLTSIDPKQNLFKMQWLLSRGTGYVGVTNQMGSRFTASGSDLKPIIDSVKSRGLLFLDSRASNKSVAAQMAKESDMPWAINNRFIDAEASRPAIDARLAEIEEIAKKEGYAVAMGQAYPVTMERVAAWIPEAEKRGFAIAPVTAVAKKQALN